MKHTTPQLENKGSLITIAGTNQCLGYLMNFTGHGIFDANLGKLDLTPDEVKIHNDLLDKAMLEGLDKCSIGQGGTFYFFPHKRTVGTFMGTLVSEKVHLSGKVITFFRNGHQYRGRLQKEAECFNFKRIA